MSNAGQMWVCDLCGTNDTQAASFPRTWWGFTMGGVTVHACDLCVSTHPYRDTLAALVAACRQQGAS